MSARHCAPVILRLCPSIMSRRPSLDDFLLVILFWLSVVEHRDRADRRAGALTPFQRQADELEFTLAEQGFEIAEAFHVGDVELEAGFVHQRVHFAFRSRPRLVDAEMHY